jgi:hypothetical protein
MVGESGASNRFRRLAGAARAGEHHLGRGNRPQAVGKRLKTSHGQTSARPPRMGTHLSNEPPMPSGRQPERRRKIPEPTDAEDRSILYGTVFGWTAGLLRLRQGRAWNQQKPTVIERPPSTQSTLGSIDPNGGECPNRTILWSFGKSAARPALAQRCNPASSPDHSGEALIRPARSNHSPNGARTGQTPVPIESNCSSRRSGDLETFRNPERLRSSVSDYQG